MDRELPKDFDPNLPISSIINTLAHGLERKTNGEPDLALSTKRMAALAQHCAGLQSNLAINIRSLGATLAITAASEELSKADAMNMGYLIEQLGDLLEGISWLHSDVDYYLRQREVNHA